MEVTMSADQVIAAIQGLRSKGDQLNKKKIKTNHPDLMRHALHYFPDWNTAVEKAN